MEIIDAEGGKSKNGEMFDVFLKLKPEEEYDDLTKEDIDKINVEILKPDDDIFIGRNDKFGVYVIGVYVSKKMIDVNEFKESCENKFYKAIKKLGSDN